MDAVSILLRRFIDYAGLYPPAALGMQTAVRNYLAYRATNHGSALGRFIVDFARLGELEEAAGAELADMRLSVIATVQTDMSMLSAAVANFPIESVEVKCDEPLTITRLCNELPVGLERYFEINLFSVCTSAIDALGAVDARAKLRMGGTVPESFPATDLVVRALHTLADRRVSFKATAGLHHPIRSQHRLTAADTAPTAVMHGFVNLFCAAMAASFGEGPEATCRVIEERDARAFSIADDSIGWRDLQWTSAQILATRAQFFTSCGSCSFTEPLQDLEALRWL